MSTVAVNLEPIIDRYIKLRDAEAALKKEYEEKAAPVKAGREKIENYLLKVMAEQGADSIKTPAGTAYISVKSNASVADWDATLEFIREGDHWGMLERRVAKAYVEQYRSEHNDLPPGINWTEFRAVNIRRS